MKTCNKCGICKEITEFYKNKSYKDGHFNTCKECIKARAILYKKNNKEKISEYRETNKEQISEYWKDYNKNNKEKILKYNREYNKFNKDRIRIYRRVYRKNRIKEDEQFRLTRIVRCRLYMIIKRRPRTGKAITDLGCSVDFFDDYIESLFQNGMSWDNYASFWEFDHIRPISSFNLKLPEQFKAVQHYTNIQPLTSEQNQIKGSSYATTEDEQL